MSGVARFEPYGPPGLSMPAAYRDFDTTAGQLAALFAENQKLRREKAALLVAVEAEREESARLRRENLKLVTELAAPAVALTGRELRDAAYAVMGFAQTSPVPEGWEDLAARLTAAAQTTVT